MSTENVKKFYKAIVTDEQHKQELSNLTRQYQGVEMDEAQKILLVNQHIIPLAAQMGFPFTVDELRQYETELNQAPADGELSDSELYAVTGGAVDFCFGFGFGGDGAGFAMCFIVGLGWQIIKWETKNMTGK